MKLIDKDALVAEIEKRQSIVLDPLNNNIHTKRLEETYKSILSFINTLEVKDTDALIEKGCVFLKNYRQDTPDGTGYIAGIVNDKTIEDFREFMQE